MRVPYIDKKRNTKSLTVFFIDKTRLPTVKTYQAYQSSSSGETEEEYRGFIYLYTIQTIKSLHCLMLTLIYALL